jgi:DNA-binding MarR family transcriptional regulator
MGKEAPRTNRRQTGANGALAITRELAAFRYALRKFLRFSESAAEGCGITPQQHQLMLGIAGYTQHGHATVSELAEFLQERHHGVSELVARCIKRGLVRKTQGASDRRVVLVSLTRKGELTLAKLSKLHKTQVEQLRSGLLRVSIKEEGKSATARKAK